MAKLTIYLFLFISTFFWVIIDRDKQIKELSTKNIELQKKLIIYKMLPVGVTCYNAERSQTDNTPTITATNQKVREGGVAVSKELEQYIPLGSNIIIGTRSYVVNDRMSQKLKGYRMDIFSWNERDIKKDGIILVPLSLED